MLPIPVVPVAALLMAVLFWFAYLYYRRTALRSTEIRALGLLVCVDATGVLVILALCSSQSYLVAFLERMTF